MVANQVEVQAGFRFVVTVDDIHLATFTEFVMPNLQVETLSIKEGGQNSYAHTLPVRVTTGNATLRRGFASDMRLLGWYLDVLKGDIAKATRQVTVTMLNTKREPIFTWNFRDAYPIKWTGPALKADQSAVAVEAIEFVYHEFVVSQGGTV